MPNLDPPAEVAKIRAKISEFFSQEIDGRRLGSSKCAAYAFFDYDGEPIYVGQTIETLGGRVSRHLTGRRSDSVAKFVLDPFEVLSIEVWPGWDVQAADTSTRKAIANRMEYEVYKRCLEQSHFGAVLNEGAIQAAEPIDLPLSYRAEIIPPDLHDERSHPDVRMARRAMTVASLARLISERKVGKALRATLLVQCQRLDDLANKRYLDFVGAADDLEDDQAHDEDE